jgi:hypothetical protein
MHKPYHAAMTRAALAGALNPAALEAVVAANLGQDSLLNLLRGEFHFDGNALPESYAYVEQQRRQVAAALPGDPPAAWAAFGRMTHALQDFYAHTNFVALWLEERPGCGADEVRREAVAPQILQSPRLAAARVYYPWEALTIIPALIPLMRRLLPPNSHANMNLDEPGRGALFPLAIAAATRRTELAFEEICGRLEGEARDAFLGKT